MSVTKAIFSCAGLIVVCLLSGCSSPSDVSDAFLGTLESDARLTRRMSTYQDLIDMPAPRGKIVTAVYSFRDQSGQYKPAPSSSFSTAVTQGAAAMLVNVLNDSGWFIPLEREGLQNILTERKIIRAALKKDNVPVNNSAGLPSLLAANIMLEGGIVGYDSNIHTGGAGARYFGIGASEKYRVDEVTVNLRAIDIRTGRILHSVLTSKKILSREIRSDVYRFIEFKHLLEMEAGITTNDPAQLCVLSAIESAVAHLIVDGVIKKSWSLADPNELNSPVIQAYQQQRISSAVKP
ncbi:CsgG/HfaB family protein [Marinobacterium jannaschii]|uniref:CsgG/HfaB family protein n=1 Tax=Marinobacterium jannaschii TaxID=64970 RepID=UPI000688FC15|nr:CsgG/HfaB family protein [Marinobacterium jannaschii]